MLILLITAVTGAWAETTTHVVTQENVNTIFSGDGYTLSDAIQAGDILDFQDTIEFSKDDTHSLVINKPVNIVSSTQDAVLQLNTETLPANQTYGDPSKSFVINKAGAGTTVNGIQIKNTLIWLYNTSNVTFTDVNIRVENSYTGQGTGHVAIRYSDHINFYGCHIFTKDNAGNSAVVLTGSSYCTFVDSNFESSGNTGNLFYLNSFNTNDKPADFPTENNVVTSNDNDIIDCTFTYDNPSSYKTLMLSYYRNHIEGCTFSNVSISTSYGGISPKSPEDGCIYFNNTTTSQVTLLAYSIATENTFAGNVTTGQNSTVADNDITGNVTVSMGSTVIDNDITGNVTVGKGSTVIDNTIVGNMTISSNSSDYIGSTCIENNITGTVTFNSNSKNNILIDNTITSNGDYAVVMATTSNANNTVQYNDLKAATRTGDDAVNARGSGNIIDHNTIYDITLAENTVDAANWTIEPNRSFENETVTISYSGVNKVNNVKAVKKATETTDETTDANTEEAEFTEGVELTDNGNGTWTLANMPAFDIEMLVEYDGEPTAITNIKGEKEESATYYDLSGRQVNGKPSKAGIYVKGNKKLMIE